MDRKAKTMAALIRLQAALGNAIASELHEDESVPMDIVRGVEVLAAEIYEYIGRA